MYISRLKLNPRSRQVQSELRDPYQMHRTLSKAFGDGEDQYKAARCLFRVDESSGGEPVVLVQSLLLPDWAALQTSGSYMLGEPEAKEFRPALRTEQCLQFRLKANPTVRRDGKRLGLYREEEHLDWLRRKAEASGFRVLSVNTRADKLKAGGHGNAGTIFCSVQFDGVLRVTNADLLIGALEAGIGSGKGFGFGLLSVAPVR